MSKLTIAHQNRMVAVLEAMGADMDTRLWLAYDGEPHRKMRPKFARRGRHTVTYQPDEDVAAEARTARHIKKWITRKFTGNVALVATFYRSDRQVIDTDNLIKHVCDSGNGSAWDDDSQVTATCGFIELDGEYPRTAVLVARHLDTSMKRGTDHVGICPACGGVFSLEGKSAATKFCSQACSAKGRRKDFIPLEATA